MKIKEIKAKHIIAKSRLPDAEYVVNPYMGCEFGCLYCYASFMGRFVNEAIENWGNYVYVKTNAVELFEKEIDSLPRKAGVFLSSVTDPYQGVEAKYRLTRGILEILARRKHEGEVSILTKSSMVVRDIDLLKQIPDAEVGITVTTADDELSRFLEVRATTASERISTLKKLNGEGIRTYAFIGPLLPHFRYRPELLDGLFTSLSEAGVEKVYVEQMNLSPYIRKRLFKLLNSRPDLQQIYKGASGDEHREALDDIVKEQLNRHGLKLALDDVIYHPKWMKGQRVIR